VVDLLDDAAIQAVRVKRKHAEHDKAHVADRRVRNKLLHVRLHHGYERAIDDRDDRQRHHHRNEVHGCRGRIGMLNRRNP
jgi:hypothetical protein